MPDAYWKTREGESLTFFCPFKSLQFYFNVIINISLPTTWPGVILLSWKSMAFRTRPHWTSSWPHHLPAARTSEGSAGMVTAL